MRYHNITKDDMLNGEGLRVVLWLSGCDFACKGCHNPDTWDEKSGLLFDQGAKEELFAQLKKDYIAGVTFTGGDPLYRSNIKAVTALSKEIAKKFPHKTQWLYTGYTWNQIKDMEVVEHLAVVVDGTYQEEKRDVQLYWRGSSNQNVIDVRKSLAMGEVHIYTKM